MKSANSQIISLTTNFFTFKILLKIILFIIFINFINSSSVTKCKLTNLIPIRTSINVSSTEQLVKVLDSEVNQDPKSSKLSFYTRFKFKEIPSTYINLIDLVIQNSSSNKILNLRIRYKIDESLLQIYIHDAGTDKTEEIMKVTKSIKINIWYYFAVSFDLSSGKFNFLWSVDSSQSSFKDKNYVFFGLSKNFKQSFFLRSQQGNLYLIWNNLKRVLRIFWKSLRMLLVLEMFHFLNPRLI